MLPEAQSRGAMRDRLEELGYVVVPGFLAPDAVRRARRACEALTTGAGISTAPASAFLATPELASAVFSREAVALCGSLLRADGFAVYPNLTVRRNAATDWHIDAAFKDGLGGAQPGPEFLQCAVYLQHNGPGEGGGIDVVPRSHLRIRAGGREYAPSSCLNIELQSTRVDCAPGDLVAWDARLLHRSSPRAAREGAAPDKFAIHWTVSRSREGAVHFLHHLVRRGVPRQNLDAALARRYQDIAGIRYAEHVPPEARAALEEGGGFFATLDWAGAQAAEPAATAQAATAAA